ncbi:MAG: SGNH/GDSL hydrolase family protein [Gaiellaceae bacterium]
MGIPPRRQHSAAHAVVVSCLAIFVASLLNAQGLRKRAETQPTGWGRDIGMAATAPLESISHTLYLDRPRQELLVAIGRGDQDVIDTRIALPSGPTKPARTVTRPRPPKKAPVRSHPKPKPKPLPAFTPARPLRLWVGGDSLIDVPGQSLERAAASDPAIDVVALESQVSTGLGRPDVYNWYDRIRQVIPELRPRAVVLGFGMNDDHDYMSGLPAGHSIGPIGSRSWIAEYRRRVAGVTRLFAGSGVYVVWVGLPITRGEGRNSAYRVINPIIEQVAASFPKGATYIDTWTMFSTPKGRYADYLGDVHGKLTKMRAEDGVHYLPPAGDLVARAVLQHLAKVFDTTSWRHKARKPPATAASGSG